MRSMQTSLIILALAITPAFAQSKHLQPKPNSSMLVSTAWLAQHLSDPSVVVVNATVPAMGENDVYAKGHIPGARMLPISELQGPLDGHDSKMLSADALQAAFEKLGISDSTLVVVYAPEMPSASRVLFTLDYIGHTRFAFLNGGLERWRAEGRPVTTEIPSVTRGHITAHLHPEMVATSDWILPRLNHRGFAFIDTRSDGEYDGTQGRHGMPSEGHLSGARQLQWPQLFEDGSSLVNLDSLQRAYASRVQPGDTVVTYCWVGYRASMTYFVARYLGYPVKLYDGSYQDWLQKKLPVKAGKTP